MCGFTLLHVWSIVFPGVFHGWKVVVAKGSFTPIFSESKPPGFKDVDFPNSTMMLQVDDVFRIALMSLILGPLMYYSYTTLSTNYRWGIRLHNVLSVLFFVDLLRRHTHPHCWVINLPMAFFLLVDKLWLAQILKHEQLNMNLFHISKDYICYYWQTATLKDVEKARLEIAKIYNLRTTTIFSNFERQHPFTTFQNRCDNLGNIMSKHGDNLNDGGFDCQIRDTQLVSKYEKFKFSKQNSINESRHKQKLENRNSIMTIKENTDLQHSNNNTRGSLIKKTGSIEEADIYFKDSVKKKISDANFSRKMSLRKITELDAYNFNPNIKWNIGFICRVYTNPKSHTLRLRNDVMSGLKVNSWAQYSALAVQNCLLNKTQPLILVAGGSGLGYILDVISYIQANYSYIKVRKITLILSTYDVKLFQWFLQICVHMQLDKLSKFGLEIDYVLALTCGKSSKHGVKSISPTLIQENMMYGRKLVLGRLNFDEILSSRTNKYLCHKKSKLLKSLKMEQYLHKKSTPEFIKYSVFCHGGRDLSAKVFKMADKYGCQIHRSVTFS